VSQGLQPEGLSAPGDGPVWRVARHLGVYSIGSAISLAGSFALLPVYATQLSPSQFGVVATGQVIGLAAATVARLGLTSGMFRFLAVYHAEADARGADRAVTTGLATSAVSSSVVTALMLGGWAVIGSGAPSDVQVSGYLIAANVLLSLPTEMAAIAFRAKQQSTSYVTLSSASVILATILTIGFVVLLHGGVVAVFASAAIANGVTSLAGLIALRHHLKLRAFSTRELRRELRFGVPSVPALLADWVMQFSDRLFLTRFASLAQVGIYSLGYRIGMIEQQILGSATSAAWDPFVLSEYRAEDGARTIGRVATYFAMIGMALVVFISASAPVLLIVIHARPQYLAATTVVFLIAFANFFAAMQHLFSAPTSIRVRPELGTMFRGLGAVVNIVLNLALIPEFGMLGAAWSTVATFVFTAAITEVIGRRLWRIAYEYRKLLLIVVGGLATQVCIELAQRAGVLLITGLSPLWSVALFGGWLLATRTFSMDEVRSLLRRLRPTATGSGSLT
jgi:O-antigen/teichoic acid export membrane protein